MDLDSDDNHSIITYIKHYIFNNENLAMSGNQVEQLVTCQSKSHHDIYPNECWSLFDLDDSDLAFGNCFLFSHAQRYTEFEFLRKPGSGVMSGTGSDLKVFSKIRLERGQVNSEEISQVKNNYCFNFYQYSKKIIHKSLSY